MSDLKKVGAKIVLEGEKEYRQALKNITSEQKVLKSEMKLAQAQYKATGGSIDSMKEKSRVLTEQISSQKDRIDVLKEALEKSKEQYGETSQQANNWQIQLNNAETELVNLNSQLDANEAAMKEAASGAAEAKDAVGGLGTELDNTESSSSGWGSKLLSNLSFTDIVNAGKLAISAISNAAQAVYQAVADAAAYADDVLTESAQNGFSTDEIQVFKYSSELIDTPVEQIETAMTKIKQAMFGAKDGTAKYQEAFENLGVAYQNDDGTMRDANTVFWETVDALGRVEDPAIRDEAAMDLFGRKAKELTGLIDAGSQGFADYAKEAENMGLVLSEKQLSALGETNDAIYRLDQAVEGFKLQASAKLAPAVTEVLDLMTSAVVGATGLITGNKTEFEKAIDEINGKIKETSKVFDNTPFTQKIEAIETNAANAETLADTIFDLAGKTSLTETEERRLQGALSAINKIIPGLNLQFNKQTGSLSKTREEVTKLTSAYKDQAIEQAFAARRAELVAAYGDAVATQLATEREMLGKIGEHDDVYKVYRSYYDGAVKAGEDAATAITTAWDKMTTPLQDSDIPLTEDLAKLRETYNNIDLLNIIDDIMAAENTMLNAQGSVDEADAALAQYNEDLDYAKEKLGIAGEAIDDVNSELDEQQESLDMTDVEVEELTESLTDLEKQIKAYADASGVAAEDVMANFTALADAYANAYQAAESSITGQTGLFTELSTESETTANDLYNNLVHQNEVLAQWTKDIQTLKDAHLADGLIDQLIAAGPSAAKAVHEMATAAMDETNEFIGNMNSAYETQMGIKEAFATEMAETKSGFLAYANELGISADVVAGELAERGASVGTAYGSGIMSGIADGADLGDTAEDIAAKAAETAPAYEAAGKTAADSYTAGMQAALATSEEEITNKLTELEGKFTTTQETVGGYGTDTAADYLDNLTAGLADEAKLEALQASVDGITEKLDTAETDISETAWDTGYGYMDALSAALGSEEKNKTYQGKVNAIVQKARDGVQPFKDIGTNMGDGLIDGIIGKLTERAGEVAAAVAGLDTTARTAMDVHSPSRVTAETGSYIGEGFVNGAIAALQDGMPDIASEIDRLSNTMAASAEGSLSGLSLSPAVVSVASGDSGATRELVRLREDVAQMTGQLASLQIVLDSGELVGALTGPLDASMARQTTYAQRRT